MDSPQVITFTCSHQDAYSVQVATDQLFIEDVVDAFRAFLLAAGYHPNNVREHLGEQD